MSQSALAAFRILDAMGTRVSGVIPPTFAVAYTGRMATIQSVLDDVMSLQPIEREIVLVHLLAAFRGEPMPGGTVDWEAEVATRMAQLSAGSEPFVSDREFDVLLRSAS